MMNIQNPDRLTTYPLPVGQKAEESFTLPSYLYTDPSVYELEKAHIFYRSWQYVAHRCMFRQAGDYVTLRIADQNIFAIRGDDDVIRAFHNVCRHRAHELLPDGAGNVERAITCPYHAWTYQRDGTLRGAPLASRRPGFDKTAFPLKPVRLELFLDCVFVNLDPGAPALAEFAGDMEEDVRSRIPFFGALHVARTDGQGESRIEAGWKVVVDNYVECYHCDHAHPAFSDIICMDSYQHDTFGLWSRQLGGEIRPANSAYPVDPDTDFMLSAFWYLWPNTTINVLPGKEELSIAAIRPSGPESTLFEGHTLSATGRFDEARMTYSADILVPEDIRLCESVQRGLRSFGYSQGPLVADGERTGRGEHSLHHFHRLVRKALAG